MSRIVNGNPKDLIWKEGNPYCPYCKEMVRASQIDMGGNHSYYHLCRPNGDKNQVRYKFSGREFDLKELKNE